LPPLYLHNSYDTIVNGDTVTVSGLELFFNYSPKTENHRFYGGYSLLDAKGFRTDKDLEISYPDRIGYLGGHVDITQRHQVSATLYYVDSMSWTDTTHSLESYERLDLRYRYLVDRKRDIKLEVIGYNVVDDYSEYRNYAIKKETLLVRLSGNF
jgi:hypothetical protein